MENHRNNFVLTILTYAAQRNVDVQPLCKHSGLDLKQLKQASHPTITAKQFNDLWLNVCQMSGDPFFGLHMGESLQLAALGIVGQIIQYSKTVGEALALAAQSVGLITDLFSMHVARTNKTITISFKPNEPMQQEFPFAFRQMADLSMVFAIHELDGLVFEKLVPKRIKMPLPKTVSSNEYERVLRCAPSNSATTYSMEFPDRYWDAPIITANYELQQLLLKKIAEPDSTHASREAGIKKRIQDYVSSNAYLGIPTLEAVSANFNTTPRTLQRKLKEEGITYQELTDAVKKSLALQYVKSGDYPLKEISYLLGYNELSAFTRAFKRWTGFPPGNMK